jgi:opacity protein-like surface antigen
MTDDSVFAAIDAEPDAAARGTSVGRPLSQLLFYSIAILIGVSSLTLPAVADEMDGESIAIPGVEEPPEEEEGEPDWARTGAYVMASAHYAIEDIKGPGLDWKDAPGASFRVGYRIVPRLSIEAQAEWEPFDSHAGPNFDAWTVTVNWRAYFTKTRIQPYMLLGVGALMARGDVEGNDVILRVGLGIDWNITENIGIVTEAQYVPALENLSPIDFFSVGLGLQYKF